MDQGASTSVGTLQGVQNCDCLRPSPCLRNERKRRNLCERYPALSFIRRTGPDVIVKRNLSFERASVFLHVKEMQINLVAPLGSQFSFVPLCNTRNSTSLIDLQARARKTPIRGEVLQVLQMSPCKGSKGPEQRHTDTFQPFQGVSRSHKPKNCEN